jgi:hypothetical protein
MKTMLCLLLLAGAGCYPAYVVRRPLPTEPPVSKEEIIRMSSAGISDPVMIDLIEKRGANPLAPDDLVALKNAGTPDDVVQKAIASERKVVERVVVDDYYAYPYYGYPYYGGYPRGYMGVRVYR